MKKWKKERKWPSVVFLSVLLLCAAVSAGLLYFYPNVFLDRSPQTEEALGVEEIPSWVDVQLIRVDGASRRGEKLEAVRDIAVHYVGNPNTSAQANRNYFDSPDSTVSSHFLVGLEGEVILCVPLDEKSSATNERNRDTISIEVCHPDETGVFSEKTYRSLIRLLSWLCEEFDLKRENLIRHYDVTGKKCPLYYVEHPEKWEELKNEVIISKENEEET